MLPPLSQGGTLPLNQLGNMRQTLIKNVWPIVQ